ncbi:MULTISPECIES: DUF3303 domain-containing protein [Nocardia]|uniref:DUF3303 domain-containing protein n=1 Tax=Nocardia TaxID=1817 RepID=UPI0013571781|nr:MULTISPECIES: DUF3303 family protein [Nocardia]MBF6206590.1 DUF3303 family protein [Streptomyces gardneri]
MKYMVSWTYRWTGSATENEAAIRRALEVFANWKPLTGMAYHQFVGRLDGSGGFAVVETDNPMDLADAPNKFAFFAEYQIYPVVDIADAVQAVQEGAEFRASIT